MGLRNTTLKHSVVKPRDAFLKGAIAEIASRDLIALDVPLSGIGSLEKWMSNMSWCQCRNFAAHPHYVTEEGHDWFEIGEDAMPQGLLPALRETIKERGPPTAIHARCITSRDQRYCVAENALKET